MPVVITGIGDEGSAKALLQHPVIAVKKGDWVLEVDGQVSEMHTYIYIYLHEINTVFFISMFIYDSIFDIHTLQPCTMLQLVYRYQWSTCDTTDSRESDARL